MSLIERKALLEPLVANKPGLQFNGHDAGDGELILQHAGKLGFEGVVSKTIDAPYAPGNRGLWRKAKALNRQEVVFVGWSDPEGSRPHLGALLLGYYTDDGKLIYAGRVGTGMPDKVLADLRRRLDPLARKGQPDFDGPRSCFRPHFRRSEHDRIVGGAIIRALSEPVVVGCDPKHHRPNRWIVSLFGQRPHFFGSQAPVLCVLEGITRVGDALACQMAFLHFPRKSRYRALFGAATPQR